MTRVVLLLFWVLCDRTDGLHIRGDRDFNGTLSGAPDVVADVDLSAVIRLVDPRFLSVTIDASLASEEKFMYLLGSPKIRTLAKALTPGFLRFGGTRQDFMVFTPRRSHLPDSGFPAAPSCDELELPSWLEERLTEEWTRHQPVLLKEDLQRKYRRVKFTEFTVDLLHAFANCSGLDLIFGLNALLRTADNSWNSSNARSLLQYCQSRRYRMNWELGNEPNSYEKKAGVRVDGVQLGLDFTRLREMMSESKLYQDAGLYGPDVGQPREHRVDILEGFLKTGAEAVDACTWHHYYVNGRDTSLDDFLDPEVLDSLAVKTKEVMEKVQLVSPGKTVWLGETSSAYGGGALGLSDTFVAGFMWLDKLGLGATLGLDVVMRQVFVGSGSYHLVDDELDPLPDYWLSVLYKRLVGPEVLKVEAFCAPGRSRRVRLYLHCSNTNSYSRGAVTLMSMNLSEKPVSVSAPALVSSSTVEAFVLQAERPGEEGLYSRSVKLNGDVLKMVDDKTLPDLTGTRLPPAERLRLPAFSLAFFVFTDARAAACRRRHGDLR
ncbi:heparanase isoform X2 [Seriola aureovittata]|uniref:heparanase isoform X2 n=1 Tax=Seriola aureovittata TaxID=2871759 RepID=UPI0024BEA9F0|nr:heparanase isoform X2 [Seriola aureovittata]